MKQTKRFAVLAMSMACGTFAMAAEPDSVSVEQLNEVVVTAVRVPKHAPFAVSKVDKKQLETFSRTGQELPFLLSRTPGIMAWSENGLGTGTTYMRIRGAAGSRVNVTLDGVALNSPEDQCVFWANTNSYASLLGNVQIQRGVGSSSNGDGAFGGTVAMTTAGPRLTPHLEVNGSYGSYNTYNTGFNFGSGLLGNHWTIDGAWHHTGTDGYIHGTKGNSGSYYAGITYFNTARTLKLSYKNLGNYEKTGQAWSGIDTGDLLDWNYGGMGTGIHGYQDMVDAGLGRYNTLYECLVDGGDPSKGTERYRLKDGSLWERTTDNFFQNHNLLSLAYRISDRWKTAGTIHYTHGHGYYDEFRYNNKLKKFGLANFRLSNGETLEKTDFIRQKGLTQDVYGVNWNINYEDEKWDVIGGFAMQTFEGDHYGHLTYMGNDELEAAYLKNGKYTYYDSKAVKTDQMLFAKATYNFHSDWSAFADLQYRHVYYMTNGINDKFYENADGTYSNQLLNITKKYDFLNPKAGISYHHGGHKAYASYALGHREPERNNFTDNGSYPAPKAESVHDVELGYSYTGRRWFAAVGLYAMKYYNQFVQTGQQSDIGEALTTNIKDSYRTGVELQAGVNVTKWLSLEANAALSKNAITDFDEVVEDWDNGSQTIHYDHSTLAFSPAALVNGFVDFHVKGFQATWHTGFVSKQYLDNTECDRRSLPKYSRTDIHLGYDWKISNKGLKNIVLGCDLNNIFNKHYAASGWVYSAIYASGGNPEGNRYTQIGYIPMAGFTAMGSIALKF
ncbi:MAG: TonB-dependent receptor plug domain-containing protein [Bacteroidaceae bacterium]|nr:TonB-dependent receptor plug domain-containing protein [Bacteroidaceae bacterium]